jgi:hypothetical protein
MKPSFLLSSLLFFITLLVAFSSPARDVSRAGRQHRAYLTEVREQRQRTKARRLESMGRSRWEIRQQRRDARRFGR